MTPRPQRRFGVLLKLAYDGSAFSGLAAQKNARTIAGVLQEAIASMDPAATRLRVASRTDAGVHARGQYVVFDTDARISMRGWALGLTGVLPPQIAILEAMRVEPGFEPSRHARGKLYRYLILQGSVRDPFLHNRAWRVYETLDHELMRREADLLLGCHDFRAFRSAADARADTVREIRAVRLAALEERCLSFEIEGDRFLHNMVRIIVGTLVDIGRGKLAPAAVTRAFASGNRLELGMTAPAEGLCLERIDLELQSSEKWPNQLGHQPSTR